MDNDLHYVALSSIDGKFSIEVPNPNLISFYSYVEVVTMEYTFKSQFHFKTLICQ